MLLRTSVEYLFEMNKLSLENRYPTDFCIKLIVSKYYQVFKLGKDLLSVNIQKKSS